MQNADGKNHSGGNQERLRQVLDQTMQSLGGPIYKTIIWHMNNKGLFNNSKSFDIKAFNSYLKELIGPGADMIMEDAWQTFKKESGLTTDNGKGSPVDRMIRLLGSEGEAQ